jgi:hypothetical protein
MNRIYRRKFTIYARTIACFSLLSCFALNTSSAAPVIEADERTHDAGVVRATGAEQSVQHTYTIKNEGDSVLNISNVKTSCGCTTAELARKTLAPGESVPLIATMNLRGRKGKTKKSITVSSNDPKTPFLQLVLAVDIQRDVQVNPPFVNFRYDPQTKSARNGNVTVVFNGDIPRHITHIDTNALTFCTLSSKVVRPGFEYHLSLTFAPGAVTNTARKTVTVTLHTDHPDYKTIDVPVSYYTYLRPKTQPVGYYPRQITIPSSLPKNKTFQQTLIVRSNLNKPMKVISVTPPNPDIKVIRQQTSKAYARFNVVFPNTDATLNGKTILIKTQTADEPPHEHAIPINIR